MKGELCQHRSDDDIIIFSTCDTILFMESEYIDCVFDSKSETLASIRKITHSAFDIKSEKNLNTGKNNL